MWLECETTKVVNKVENVQKARMTINKMLEISKRRTITAIINGIEFEEQERKGRCSGSL